MKIYKLCVNNKGITLIELLIGISLLVIVISIAFLLYFFGITSFSLGTSRGDVQQNARMAADFITSEVRLAETVEILGSNDIEDLDGNFHYIFLENGSIIYKEKGETPAEKLSDISQKVDFGLVFKISDEDNNSSESILQLTVSAADEERNYDVKTDILILNLADIIIEPENGSGGIGIRYRYPQEFEQ